MSLPEAVAARVASLREHHAALAERSLTTGVSAPERQAFIDELTQVGAEVPPCAERDSLRNLLFFWSTDQAARGGGGGAAPPPTLLPYDEAYAAAIAANRAAAASARADTGIFQTVMPDRHGPAGPGQAPGLLPQAAPAALAAGVLPSDAEARRIVRIAAMAREWRSTDAASRRGYLIGDATTLAEAARYAPSDPEIAALVEASQAALDVRQAKWRLTMIGGAVTAALLALLAVATVFWFDANRRRAVAETKLDTQSSLYAEAAQDREQVRAEVWDAVDAMQRGDLAPLRALLQRLGNADRADLDRLELASPVPAVKLARRAPLPGRPPPVAAAPPPAGPTCTGFLWLGVSGGPSRLADQRDPTLLKAGDTSALSVRGELRSQAGWPTDEAAAGTRLLGFIPAETTFKLVGAAGPSASQSDQVWAQVAAPREFCTRVFVQFVGATSTKDAVLTALRALHLEVPPAERIPSAAGLAEIRYFWPEDRSAAEQVAQTLARFHGGHSLRLVALTEYPRKPSRGTIEAWLDLSHG